MNQIPGNAMLARYVTPQVVEQAVGLPAGVIDSFGFLVMQEMAKGIGLEVIAKGLEVDVATLAELADSITGGPGGFDHDLWKACVVTIRTINVANQQIIGHGWDALEAMAVNRLAQVVQDTGSKLSVKDSVAIAQLANKAVRRQAGEGGRGGASVSIHQPAGGGGEMSLELKGGNLGSIRLSLSSRVQEQLEQPKVIEGEKAERRMLGIEEIRKVTDV